MDEWMDGWVSSVTVLQSNNGSKRGPVCLSENVYLPCYSAVQQDAA